MGLMPTATGFVLCLGLLVVAVVLDRRPYRPGKLNYVPLMMVLLAGCLVLARHLVTLL